ncbi:TetR/AcrR family transcriptional regulator [Litoribacillus peritrichatus]|uniref:HTH tetR-type domain-containing protein n=1 Tax=Litoribacillus peritrichatus TaxID=718191 RepID=A0ABP7MHU1_9GAMM
MGRPNKSEEKRHQILDAFERIILKDGFAKASQRKIAQEADMNQPMIHHYFAGSEEMLDALLNRVMQRYQEALDDFVASHEQPNLESLIEFVCSEKFHRISRQNEVFFALIGQGGHQDSVFQKMSDVYHEFHNTIVGMLRQGGLNEPDRVGYMLMCFIIGHDWAKKLGFGEQRNQDMTKNLINLASMATVN